MDYNKAIESICYKFGQAVTEFEVFRWLRNFDESEWTMALDVLDKVVYYSSDRIDENLEVGIKKIVKDHKGEKLRILPVGKVGKSGAVMVYHINKAVKKLKIPKEYFEVVTLEQLNSQSADTVLILLDDYSGTGNTLVDFYKNDVSARIVGKNMHCYALCVAYMKKAKEYIKANSGLKIYGDEYGPAFVRRGSVFGYEPSMKKIREFCFKYGAMMFPNWQNSPQKPLGFMNTQALICFEHTTPNNTLPILWFDKKILATGKEWNPLFPRFANARIERGRRLRRSSNFWLSAMSRMQMPNIDWAKEHTTEAQRLIGVIAQKYHHKSDLLIGQLLGISLDDLEEIVNIGKGKGLFDDDGGLTQEARSIYEEIRKKDSFVEHDIRWQLTAENIDEVYVPKSFRGIT